MPQRVFWLHLCQTRLYLLQMVSVGTDACGIVAKYEHHQKTEWDYSGGFF